MAAAIGLVQLERRPESRRLFGIDDVVGGQLEVFRHHADDFARDAVDLDGAAEHVGAVEARLPELVAQDHDAERVDCGFGFGEVAPDERLHAEGRKRFGVTSAAPRRTGSPSPVRLTCGPLHAPALPNALTRV